MEECLDAIEQKIISDEKSYLVAVNSDVILKIEQDEQLKEVTDHADFVIVDGKPLIWIAKKQGIPIEEKISGSDLVPLLCERAARRKRRGCGSSKAKIRIHVARYKNCRHLRSLAWF